MRSVVAIWLRPRSATPPPAPPRFGSWFCAVVEVDPPVGYVFGDRVLFRDRVLIPPGQRHALSGLPAIRIRRFGTGGA